MKKRYVTTLPFLLMANLLGSDDALLSGEKQEILRQQQSIYESEYEKLRTNWISPINLIGNYTFNKSAMGSNSDTESISASFSQDIFRSGGITYQIAYAGANKEAKTILHQQSIANLNLQLFNALLNYEKSRYQLEQSAKRIANYEIEVFIKRQQFDAGKTDITELNNALMNKSSELKTHASLKYALIVQRQEITKLSNIDPDTFALPRFDLVEKEKYLSNQWDIQYANTQSKTLSYLYEVTKSNYLPSVAVNGSIGYQNYNSNDAATSYDGHYYNGGLSLTLPFTYNASATVQEARATYLQEAAAIADKRRELESDYAQSIALIDSYHETIKLISENLKLYDELINATQAGVDAGMKTGYDLQTLTNTKTIEELEIAINKINIQILLAQLHFALNPSKELL